LEFRGFGCVFATQGEIGLDTTQISRPTSPTASAHSASLRRNAPARQSSRASR
jgi:hypothetical protein